MRKAGFGSAAQGSDEKCKLLNRQFLATTSRGLSQGWKKAAEESTESRAARLGVDDQPKQLGPALPCRPHSVLQV